MKSIAITAFCPSLTENEGHLKKRGTIFRYLALIQSVRETVGIQASESPLHSNSKTVNELTSTFDR